MNCPSSDEELHKLPYLTFPEGSKELNYMRQRRQDLGGHLPSRRTKSYALDVPTLERFQAVTGSQRLKVAKFPRQWRLFAYLIF